MPMPTVDHIANVSFKDHFLSAQEAAPKNGSIQVNGNTFDVTFVGNPPKKAVGQEVAA
ncbi:MAG: hypothetical protein IJI73_01160 [Kiritimatiellae bacterium]|nr:hypothetical protein [Kiritimatiellia bacterium]